MVGNVRCLEGLCAGTRIGMECGIILPSYRHVSQEVWYGGKCSVFGKFGKQRFGICFCWEMFGVWKACVQEPGLEWSVASSFLHTGMSVGRFGMMGNVRCLDGLCAQGP
jgi:hypothetical protein